MLVPRSFIHVNYNNFALIEILMFENFYHGYVLCFDDKFYYYD